MKIVLFGILTFLMTFSAISAEKAEKKFDWYQEYYKDPRPELFELEVLKRQQQGVFLQNESLYPSAAFFSQLFTQNEVALEQWFSIIDLFSKDERKVFLTALYWADSAKAAEKLENYRLNDKKMKKFVDKLVESPRPDFRKISNPTPLELDACWASCFATGDDDFVNVVIKCAVSSPENKSGRRNKMAASMSLRKMAKSNPDVKKACLSFQKTAGQREKVTLNILLGIKVKK